MGTGGLFLRKLRAKVADEPTGFVWLEEGKLAGSGYPASRAQVEWLAKSGIRSILTLTPDPLPSGWTKDLGLELGHVAMMDHQAPSVGQLDRGVEFIANSMREGRPVVVHCLAGEGRTGSVLAAFLMREKRMSAEDALKTIRKVKPAFVERAQEKALKDFESSLR